jgi:hypothetical protein
VRSFLEKSTLGGPSCRVVKPGPAFEVMCVCAQQGTSIYRMPHLIPQPILAHVGHVERQTRVSDEALDDSRVPQRRHVQHRHASPTALPAGIAALPAGIASLPPSIGLAGRRPEDPVGVAAQLWVGAQLGGGGGGGNVGGAQVGAAFSRGEQGSQPAGEQLGQWGDAVAERLYVVA